MPAKAYSYLRFSTPEQSKGDSTRRQTQLAESYCARHKLRLDTELNLQDFGVSAFRGANAATGALAAFLQAIVAGAVPPGSFLLIESIDRLSRQAAWNVIPTLQAIVNAGITLVTLSPEREINTKTLVENPFLLMEVLLYMTRANEESATKSRRVAQAWTAKRANGATRALTAIGPSWLRLESGKWQVIEERAAIVRRIFEEARAGRGAQAISADLNRESVPVFGRGKHWHRTFIIKLLSSEAVIGTMQPHRMDHTNGKRQRVPDGEPLRDYFPAIVDAQTFDAVRALRDSRSPARGGNAGRGMRNLFGGLSKCGRCGATVTFVNKSRKGENWTYLVCTRAKQGAGCTYESIPYDKAEGYFLSRSRELIANAPVGVGNELHRELRNVEDGMGHVEDQIENLARAVENNPSPALLARLTEREATLAELRQDRDRLNVQIEDAFSVIVKRRLSELRRTLHAKPFDTAAANAMMRQAFRGITVDYESHELVLQWRHGGESRCEYSIAYYGFEAE